ncbi:pseudouridine synthase [Baffinella frigidus]|nr:pseudouridine synthase [Cryptophyta sp. CCMP2293]
MCLGTVDHPGRAASTEVEVVARGVYRGSNVTKVSLAPSTGRRHQLRVHLASIGHSIVGDSTYCGTAAASLTGAPRMMLHALSLALPLPDRYGGPREWVAPDPFLDVLEPALGESG